VCDDNSLGKYVNILNENNYDTYALKEYDAAIDYDSLDIRIFLIEKRDFIKFISEYIDNDKVYFYNSIIIQFDNGNGNGNGNGDGDDCDIIGEADRIKREYKKISNNNEIII
jgi:stress response protein SCP2